MLVLRETSQDARATTGIRAGTLVLRDTSEDARATTGIRAGTLVLRVSPCEFGFILPYFSVHIVLKSCSTPTILVDWWLPSLKGLCPWWGILVFFSSEGLGRVCPK